MLVPNGPFDVPYTELLFVLSESLFQVGWRETVCLWHSCLHQIHLYPKIHSRMVISRGGPTVVIP